MRSDLGTIKNQETFRRFLAALSALDVPAMIAEFDESGAWELPFAPTGLVRVHQGADSLAGFIGGIPAAFDYLQMSEPAIETTETGRLIAQLSGTGRVTSSGLDYSNDYVMVGEFSPKARILRLTEYYDPQQLIVAFGGLDGLAAIDG